MTYWVAPDDWSIRSVISALDQLLAALLSTIQMPTSIVLATDGVIDADVWLVPFAVLVPAATSIGVDGSPPL